MRVGVLFRVGVFRRSRGLLKIYIYIASEYNAQGSRCKSC